MYGLKSRRSGITTTQAIGIAVVVIIIIVAAALLMGGGGGQQATTATTASPQQTTSAPATTTTTTAQAQPYQIVILTGSVSGTYYPVGTAYAQLLEKYSGGLIKATAKEGRASAANIQALCQGGANAALAQNDIAYYAYHGTTIKPFEGKPQKCIRAVAVLYPETIQIVTLADSGINSIYDLAGKKVAVGPQGSGTYWNARQILEAAGVWDQIIPEYKKFSDIVDALKLGTIDAAFLTAGIPTSAVEQLAAEADIKIIPVPDEVYQKLKQQYPFYIQQVIPAGTYEDIKEDVKTVAVMSMLLVRDDVPDNVVYQMTKILFEHADELKQQVNKLSVRYISLEHALDGLSIPLHPGAYKYYQEKGLQVPDQFKPPTSG